MEQKENSSEKKVYTQPKLYVYGDVREITRTTQNPGAVTDAARGSTKTA
jgi:hypothetical protein